jgi:hypothetical protein
MCSLVDIMSAEIWRCCDLLLVTDVSEQLAASIFTVKQYAELY